MDLNTLKTSLILSLGVSIGANIILVAFLVGIVSLPVLFPTSECDYEKEYLKIRDSFGKGYHHLPMEQRQQFDDDFHFLQSIEHLTQEEFDLQYEDQIASYGLDYGVFLSEDKMKTMFWGWMKMCE